MIDNPSNPTASDTRKLLPAKVAAKRLGCVPDYVSRLCRDRELSGVRIGRAWFVHENSLRHFEQARSLQKAARSHELSRQRRAEIAAWRTEARRPLMLAFLSLLAIVVAGGALLGLRAIGALDSSRNAPPQTFSPGSSTPRSSPAAPEGAWVPATTTVQSPLPQ